MHEGPNTAYRWRNEDFIPQMLGQGLILLLELALRRCSFLRGAWRYDFGFPLIFIPGLRITSDVRSKLGARIDGIAVASL